MNADEYVPSDEEMLSAYVTGRMMRDGLMRTEAEQEFRRGLARVRRDAAREALDGLAEHARRLAQEGALGPGTVKVQFGAAVIAEEYRDTHYPEETP